MRKGKKLSVKNDMNMVLGPMVIKVSLGSRTFYVLVLSLQRKFLELLNKIETASCKS